MEKEIGSKEVKMGVIKNSEVEPQNIVQSKKLSYEKLNEVCMQLSQQNQQMNIFIQRLQKQLHEMESIIRDKRLDYLFKVVDNNSCFIKDFVDNCIAEIQYMMTPPQPEENSKEETKEQ